MKAINISKLYDQLSSKEKAQMVFEAQCMGDNDSATKIVNSVPRYSYTARDASFSETYEGLFSLASAWAIFYWQFYCKMLGSIHQLISQPVPTDEALGEQAEKLISCEEQAQFWEDRLSALGLILKALHESHNLDVNAVLEFAGAKLLFGVDQELEHLPPNATEFYLHYLVFFECQIDNKVVPEDTADYIRGDPPTDLLN